MSEKQFTFECDENNCQIFENDVVDLLNSQEEKIKDLNAEIRSLRKWGKFLEKENEQLRKDKAQLKERLRECRIRLDRFNCR